MYAGGRDPTTISVYIILSLKYLSLLGIMFLLTLIACQNDDEGDGTLALKFEAKVNNTPLEFNKYYVIKYRHISFIV